MARNIAWVVAALLLVSASGQAAGLGEITACEREQAAQQRPGVAKPDKDRDKDKDNKSTQRTDRPKWWIDAKLRAELGVTDQQSAAVEAVWQKSAPTLRELREKLTKLEDSLSKLTNGPDESAVIAQSERVETLRAELNRGRTLMIYRMNKILTAEQRAKVKAMFEQHDSARRGPSPDKS